MVESKRKSRDGERSNRKPKYKASKKKGDKRRTGPRLPNSLRKELESLNNRSSLNSEEEDDVDSDVEERIFKEQDLYEYEEEIPEEETRKNHRFDHVENLEYELPKEFEDENVESDDDDDDDDGEGDGRTKIGHASYQPEEDVEEEGEEQEDEGRHARMLQGITGMPSEAFERKTRRKNVVVSEAYPESEYNPSHDILDGDGRINIQDLLDPLQGKAGYNELKKRMHHLESKSAPIQPPLPKADKEKLERKAAYEHSKKEILKWEPLVKKNREAPTIYFEEDIDIGFSTVGAIASEFQPRTEFEKKIASLVHDDKVMEAHKKDGARLLELNKISVEDEIERRDRIAKMRSLLFRHEMKQKHIKKIKSKTYHRLMKKDRLKGLSTQMEMDPDAAREQAMKQEFKRAEERLTLKHKNSSKWAKRIMKRGLDAQDEGTRAAIAEQLQQHNLLTRKMNSMKDTSSSDESSDGDDDEDSAGSDQDGASKLLAKAKEKTLKVLEDDDDVPTSGVLSLPFMVRSLKKRKEAAVEEAKLALQDYETSLKQKEDLEGPGNPGASAPSGRMAFGSSKPQALPKSSQRRSEREYDNSDSEEDLEAKQIGDIVNQSSNDLQTDNPNGSVLVNEDSEAHQHSVFRSFDSIVKNPDAKTTYEVSIFASDSWRKMNNGLKDGYQVEATGKKKQQDAELASHNKEEKELSEDSDGESDDQMVDGILSSSGPKQSYELPSQADLVRSAFAGDDVEEDFEKDKQEILNEENPEPEKPILLPGWGQWTHVQKKKGLPSWILKEHETAKRKREEALSKRKDAHLKHVIISEKVDKKAEKLHTTTLPFPFTSKEAFERSIRMPIGPEFNPATAIGALNRPSVVKKSGIIIKPIKFEEVNPHERGEDQQRSEHKNRSKRKRGGGKPHMKNKAAKTKS